MGSAAGFTFNDFVLNLGPAVLVSLIVMYGLLYLWYGKELKPTERTTEVARNFKQPIKKTDKGLTKRIITVMLLVLAGFLLHGYLGIEAATVAIAGAALGLIICPVDVEEVIRDVDWVTILFFSALFMLVGTIEHLGLIHMLANFIFSVIGDNFKLLSIALVWGSGFISAIVDNVPYTAAVIPLVKEIASMVPGSSDFLWWSLALGACFGGNGTLVGASANLVMAGIAEKSGLKIDFWTYFARGAIVMIATLAVSSVYVYLRYL